MNESSSLSGGRTLKRYAYHVLVVAILLIITNRVFGAAPWSAPTPVGAPSVDHEHTELNGQLATPADGGTVRSWLNRGGRSSERD